MIIQSQPTRSGARRPGFTLIELLVTISIIALLIAIVVGVGVSVTQGAKARTTRQTLITLDRALEEYMVALGGTEPPAHVPASYDRVPGPDGPNGRDEDAGLGGGKINFSPEQGDQPERPDASVFLRQIRGVGETDAIISGIPDQFLVSTAMSSESAVDPIDADNTPSVVDAWADPAWVSRTPTQVMNWWPVAGQSLIYYVHPDNRRPDSADGPDAQDMYGQTVNNRPYFLSAGPDGFYGHWSEYDAIRRRYNIVRRDDESDAELITRVFNTAREDNIYSYEVDASFNAPAPVLSLVGSAD